MEPEALATMLNTYLEEMATIAASHGGTIDKFIGDAIVIFFGQPESRGDREDALACVRMALAMKEKMCELRQSWADSGVERPLHVRIGINSGFCTVGDFGSQFRRDYTMIGREVNLAARLEQNAEADTVLLSHGTWSLVRDQITTCERGEIHPKGFPRPVKTYEALGLVGEQPNRVRALCPGFTLGLDPAKVDLRDREMITSTLRDALTVVETLPPKADPAGEGNA